MFNRPRWPCQWSQWRGGMSEQLPLSCQLQVPKQAKQAESCLLFNGWMKKKVIASAMSGAVWPVIE